MDTISLSATGSRNAPKADVSFICMAVFAKYVTGLETMESIHTYRCAQPKECPPTILVANQESHYGAPLCSTSCCR